MSTVLKVLWCIFFALAFLPSWFSLSAAYQRALPGLYEYSGPLNIIKLALPFFLVAAFVSLRRLKGFWPDRAMWIAGGIWLIGSLFTLKEAVVCGFPGPYLREWVTMSVGVALGILLVRLPRSILIRVTWIWGGLLLLSAVLDYLFPPATEWLLSRVFDPNTRFWDMRELYEQPLTGVFGRQSFAKLLAWVPWLILANQARLSASRMGLLSVFFGVWTALILATSQRGPMLAMFVAVLVFWVFEWVLKRDQRSFRKATAWIMTYLIAFVIGILVLVPQSIWIPRLAPWLVLGDGKRVELQDEKHIHAAKTAVSHVLVRGKIFEVNWNLIRERPWGNACIPESYYRQYQMPPAHSHSFWLEQAKQRGVVFGLLHLFAWLATGGLFLLRALRAPNVASSALLAGWCAIQVSGLADHLWQVLNHAMVLGVFLAEAWFRRGDASTSFARVTSEPKT